MRQYFFDNPSASIHDAARDAKASRKALHKNEIQQIRHEVRAAIAGAQQRSTPPNHPRDRVLKGVVIRKRTTPPLPRKEGFANHPRIAIPQSDPEHNVTVAEIQAAAAPPSQVEAPPVETATPPRRELPPPAVNSPPVSNRDEKLNWIYDYCEKAVKENPNLNGHEVNAACKARFGSGVWMPDVAKALDTAREYNGIPIPKKSRPPWRRTAKAPATELLSGAQVLHLQKERLQRELDSSLNAMRNAAKELARQMKLTSTKECTISIDAEGGVDFKFTRVEVNTHGDRLDID